MRLPILAASLMLLGADRAMPAIHLNQLGFLPGTAKHAVVAGGGERPEHWQVVASDGRVVLAGRTEPFGADPASGDRVQQIDLSALATPGTYRLQVAGATSHPFTVSAGLYRPLALSALNYFYQTRAGIAIEPRYAGGTAWARPAGHPHERVTCFAGVGEDGTRWPGCRYTLDVTGGWYDAGDQGKYVVNGGIALWTLQDRWEQQPAGRSAFPDGSAALPEAGNGRDDLLDEARWEMRFLLSMQVPDGTRMALPVGPQRAHGALTLTEIDASGLVHHKVADRHWTALPTSPADDREERLLYPPSTAATLNLAATAAQAARIWSHTDPVFARTCLAAAQRAYRAALRHPDIFAAQGFTGSGGYGDRTLSDELFWATAELYATSGDATYLSALRKMPAWSAPLVQPDWAATAALGTITLATVAPALPAADREAQRRLIVDAANRFLAEERASGYHLPFRGTDYGWGSNAVLLNRAMVLALAARLTGESRYRDGVVEVMDYVLGRNPLDRSFVSGFGWNPMQHPHHRFWAHSLDNRLPPPPPGVLSGGPNATAMADQVAQTMRGHCAAQRCWRDDPRAYALNEVAINWNAPLFWVAAYLDATGGSAQPPDSLARR